MHELSYKLVSGIVENLSTSGMHVNYLKSAESFKKISGLTSVVQAALGESGAVHSAQATTSGGDPVTGFTMSMDGKLIAGSFWKVGFKDGHLVKVVGYQKGDQLIAVAVFDLKEKKIWMQPHCERGTIAEKYHLFKCCGYDFIGLYILAIFAAFFGGIPLWFMLTCATFSTPIILFLTVGLSWKDFMELSNEMNRVGNALGIAETEKIDLFKRTWKLIKSGKPDLPMGVYYI